MGKNNKLLPDSLLWSYSWDGEEENRGTAHVEPFDYSCFFRPHDEYDDLTLTVSTLPLKTTVKDLPFYKNQIKWDDDETGVL